MHGDFRVGDWLVQPDLGRISHNGQTVHVRAKVMDLLVYLAARPGEVVSKNALLDGVWGTEAVSESALTRTIAELRQAFGDDAEQPRVLETIPKRGYRLVAPTTAASDTNVLAGSSLRLPNTSLTTSPDPESVESAAASAATFPDAPHSRSPSNSLVAASVILLIAVFTVALFYVRSRSQASPEVRFTIPVPALQSVSSFAVSPDGSRVVYSAPGPDGKIVLWLRPLKSVEAEILPGTDGGSLPFWSPDSQCIGFGADGKLKRMGVPGEPAQTLADFGGVFLGGTWNRDGIIVFGSQGRGLRQIRAPGGEATDVTELDASRQESDHLGPSFLPGGRRFLYLAQSRNQANQALYVGSLESRTPTRLMAADSTAMFAAPGFVLFVRQSRLMAQPFDAASLEFTGDSLPLAEAVPVGQTWHRAAVSASHQGTLVYRTGLGPARQLAWKDRTGRVMGTIPGPFGRFVRLSPDGSRVAFSIMMDGRPQDVWTYEFERGGLRRLTVNPAIDHWPVWSPDGSRLVFDSSRGSTTTDAHALYEMPSDASTPEQLLLAPDPGCGLAVLDWSVDGGTLIYRQTKQGPPQSNSDIWVLRLGDRKRFPYLETPFNEGEASLSPDGRWLAYTSDELGPHHVFVRPFPVASGGKWQVSTDGGAHPRWRRDGGELYYYEPAGHLVAVPVTADGGFKLGPPTRLFRMLSTESPPPAPNGPGFPYDVTADGQRFLVSAPSDVPDQPSLIVVVNWPSALTRR